MSKTNKNQKRLVRKRRIRAKIFGTAKRPRLSVFRSTKHIYAQMIDDENARTLVSASDKDVIGKAKTTEKGESKTNFNKLEIAYKVGEVVAEKSLKKKINFAVFDRNGYKYHGRIASLAEGARKGGLKF